MVRLATNRVPPGWTDLPPLPEQAIPDIEIEWPRPDPFGGKPNGRFLKHGWRSLVGGLGRGFITLGLLLFSFVAYLLWGTNIKAAQYQNAASKQFGQLVGKPTVVTTAVTTTTTPSVSAVSTSPTSPTTPAPTATTTALPALTNPEAGSPVAQLDIPSIGVNGMTIISGVSVDDLKRGPGHFRSTPLPGQFGNAALAGHRTTWGAPFSNIDRLNAGDEITVTNLRGERFVYRVTGQKIVAPTDISVLGPTDVPTLTLISCHPKLSATNRIIVSAVLDQVASSAPVTAPPASTVPSPTTVETAPTTLGPSETASLTTVATSQPTTPGDELGTTDDQVDTAFQQGWFADSKAWPHVALWGIALATVALLGFALGRRTDRMWIGYVAAAAPFIVVLYFFFENVNRLLPPNL